MSHIACHTLHVTSQHMHLMCLFQISCSSFCLVRAMMESGRVILFHLASADNMADFWTALVCLEIFVVVNHYWLVLRVYVMCIVVCRQRALCQCLCIICSSHAHRCLFQISCFSFCFVSALTESGQVIPLHKAYAYSMADLGIMQACLETFVVVNPSHCWLVSIFGDVYRLVSTTCYILVPLYFIIYCECNNFTICRYDRYEIHVPFDMNVECVDSLWS